MYKCVSVKLPFVHFVTKMDACWHSPKSVVGWTGARTNPGLDLLAVRSFELLVLCAML
jgi:hypothetical protein